MSMDLTKEFSRYLAAKNVLGDEFGRRLASGAETTRKLTLRQLSEAVDLAPNQFADEVAAFYRLPRVALPQMMAAKSLTTRFSRRFLRESMLFPFEAENGKFKIAVGDPGDMAMRRAAEIVLSGSVEVEVDRKSTR